MSVVTTRLMKAAGVIALGAILQGCGATIQSPVPIVADRSDVNALVGEWNGEYSSPESGRSGSIVFRLRSATDTAYGDVVMTPRTVIANTTREPGIFAGQFQSPGRVLTIRFVRMEGRHLIGRMDPYVDPVCGCRLTTVFTGDFTPDGTIEGTYQTTGAELHHPLTSGKWKVSRATR